MTNRPQGIDQGRFGGAGPLFGRTRAAKVTSIGRTMDQAPDFANPDFANPDFANPDFTGVLCHTGGVLIVEPFSVMTD